jgi:protein arginine N-methyltransferase 7
VEEEEEGGGESVLDASVVSTPRHTPLSTPPGPQFEEERYSVVYKRPSDLALLSDVPVCCNLVVANVLEDGLLGAGIIPAVAHALSALAAADAVVLPASATVYAQAVELRTGDVCGLDMSAANLYRWHPAHSGGAPLGAGAARPLSAPVEAWYFDFGAPPERSAAKTLDLEIAQSGRFNAVMFWFDLHLHGDVHLSSGPGAGGAAPGARALQPAVQYLAGELRVEPGDTLPLLATHNTVRLRFDLETAEYLHLAKPDAAFPHRHFSMLADARRVAAYQRAIARAVAARKAADGEVHALDVGTGTGVLALLAARAGADSVVACDLHQSLCDVARKVTRGVCCCCVFLFSSKLMHGVHRRENVRGAAEHPRPAGRAMCRPPPPTGCRPASRWCTATRRCCSAATRCAPWASTWSSPTCSTPGCSGTRPP